MNHAVPQPTAGASLYDDHYGIYLPFERFLSSAGFDLTGIHTNNVARKSDEDEALAAEQATKHFGVVARDVPELAKLLKSQPVSTWNDPAVRRELGIVEVSVADVMPERLPDDPRGTGVIGDLLVLDGVASLVVAKSGFKSARNQRQEAVNPYTEFVIQMLKVARRGNAGELAVRFASDTSRKGRLVTELNRMDGHTALLRCDVYFGAQRLEGGMASLIEMVGNFQASASRDTIVSNALTGRISAVHAGNLAMAEANLPPTLEHRVDPASDAIDRRVRTKSKHLVCFHAHHIQPALAEYLAALANGATDDQLAVVLRKHQVPTTRGVRSGHRGTTFDKLSFAEASRRARRWLTYTDFGDKVAAGDDHDAVMSRRKVELIRDGRYVWSWTNPTPTVDTYDAGGDSPVKVQRDTPYEAGRLEPQTVDLGFPEQHRVEIEARWIDSTGAPVAPGTQGAREAEVPVVTDCMIRDEDGNPVPWTSWGIDEETFEGAIASLSTRGTTTSTGRTRGAYDRVIGTPDIIHTTDDDRRLRLQLMRHGSTASAVSRIYRHRRLVEHPDGPDSTSGWTSLRDSLSERGRSELTADKAKQMWHATLQEADIVRGLADAMAKAVAQHQLGDLPLEAPDRAAREARTVARRADLQARLDAMPPAIEGSKSNEKAARALLGHAIAEQDAELGADAKSDLAKARATTADLKAEQERLRAALAADGSPLPDEPTASVEQFHTVAELIAMLEASTKSDFSTGRGPGELPTDIAHHIAKSLTDWDFAPPSSGTTRVPISCTWQLTLDDGTQHALPLSWTCDDTSYNNDCNAYDAIATRVLATGGTLEDIVEALPRPTTTDAVWGGTVRPLLEQWGVHPRLRGAVVDTPMVLVRRVLATELGEQTRPDGPWDETLAAHIVASYDGSTRESWNDCAVPTDTREHATVLALAAQHPHLGVSQVELEATGTGRGQLAKHMVTPPANKKATQPSFLRWLDVGVVGPHPCPHADCPAAGAGFATVLVYLPETVPSTNATPGGVLCPDCRRLPDPAFADVRFPPEYITGAPLSGTDYRSSGTSITSGRTHVISVTAPAVPAATLRTVAAIARDLRITRGAAKEVVADLTPSRRRQALTGAIRELYDLATVRAAHAAREQSYIEQHGFEERTCACGQVWTRPSRPGRPPTAGPCCLG